MVSNKVNTTGHRYRYMLADYILKNNLKLDYLFYITNQIMKPAIQFLELIVDKPDKIFNEYIIREENRKSGKLPINYYLEGDNQIDFDDFADIINKECSDIKNKPIQTSTNTKKVVKKVIKRIIKKTSNSDILDQDFNL